MAFYAVACQATVPPSTLVSTTPAQTEIIPPTKPASLPGITKVGIDQPFELAVGQEVVISETDLHLRFERILEDSRCPRQVVCVWSGQTLLAVSIWSQDAPPETKEFSTFSKPPKTTDTHLFQGFSIKLIKVDPYPDSPGTQIPTNAYRITLNIASNR